MVARATLIVVIVALPLIVLTLARMHVVAADLLSPLTSPLPSDAPVVEAVDPAFGLENEAVRVQIRGDLFAATPYVFVGGTRVYGVTYISNTLLSVVVPAGLPSGVHEVKVCNLNLLCGRLAAGYRVVATGPVVYGITPIQGLNDSPNEILIYGANLKSGIAITVGSALLIDITELNANLVLAVVPAGLPVGAHHLVARNPDSAERAFPLVTYTALSLTSEDLYVEPSDIWTSPITVRQNAGMVWLGANVHRQGGHATLPQVTVAFFMGDPMSGGILLGKALTPPIEPRSGAVDSTFIEWDPSGLSGGIDIHIVVDPDGEVTETTKLNNTTHRIVNVLSPNDDDDPPVLHTLRVNGGAETTSGRNITIALTATDVGGSGIRSVYLVEREFNSSARQWVATQATGWMPFQATVAMTLTDRGGVRYIQGWVADRAGNISEQTVMQRIDYVPSVDRVRAGQIRIYQRWYTAGQHVAISLETLSGDADLYVWRPDGLQSWISDNEGLQLDGVAFDAPQDGVYLIEVYGYRDSQYRLTLALGGSATVAKATMAKERRASPVVSPNSQPVGAMAVPSAPPPPCAYIPIAGMPTRVEIRVLHLPVAFK